MDFVKWNHQMEKINLECQLLDDRIQKLQNKKRVKEAERSKLKSCLANELASIIQHTYGEMDDEKLKQFQKLMETEKQILMASKSSQDEFVKGLDDDTEKIL